MAWYGLDNAAWQAWHGKSGCVELCRGRHGRAGMDGKERHVMIVMVWQAWSQKLKGGQKMVYEWKIPGIYDVDAQTAGEELNRIYRENGRLEPAKIVDESRNDTAPLHYCFEWNNEIAAEKYREVQAANIVRAIVTVVKKEDGIQNSVRAYVTVEKKNYEPLFVVVSDESKREALLRKAMAEMEAFKHKYNSISELRPVFEAIDSLDLQEG